MIKWKDFLYFSKGDKIGILLLLLLIVLTGGVYAYISQFLDVDPSYFSQQKKIQSEFVEFENNLTKQVVVTTETNNLLSKSPKSKKQKAKKLLLGQVIDINSATVRTLTRIPGIGNTTAERIIEYRNSLGGFYEAEQLQEVKGITRNKFSKILPFITIEKRHKTIWINKVTSEQLSRHPYFKENQIKAIMNLREKSKIESISELARNENFIAKDIDKIEPYIFFE